VNEFRYVFVRWILWCVVSQNWAPHGSAKL